MAQAPVSAAHVDLAGFLEASTRIKTRRASANAAMGRGSPSISPLLEGRPGSAQSTSSPPPALAALPPAAPGSAGGSPPLLSTAPPKALDGRRGKKGRDSAALQRSLLAVTQAVHQLQNAAGMGEEVAASSVLLTPQDVHALAAVVTDLSAHVTSTLAASNRRRRDTQFTSLSRTTSSHSFGSSDTLAETFAAQPHIFDEETQATVMGMVSHTPVSTPGGRGKRESSSRRISVVPVGKSAPRSLASAVRSAYAARNNAEVAVSGLLQGDLPDAAFVQGLGSWEFDIFAKEAELRLAYGEEAESGGVGAAGEPPGTQVVAFHDSGEFGRRALVAVTLGALQQLGVLAALNVDAGRLATLLEAVGGAYKAENPYHNALHGADVAHGVFFMLTESGGGLAPAANLRHETRLACVLAAAAHDVGHPGVNNPYLIATGDPLAIKYNDASPLENMHAATLFGFMRKSPSNPLRRLRRGVVPGIRRAIIHLILSTDNSQHFSHVAALTERLDALPTAAAEAGGEGDDFAPEGAPLAWSTIPDTPPPSAATLGLLSRSDSTTSSGSAASPMDHYQPSQDELLVLSMVVHACDISNPARPWHLYAAWTDRIVEEFQRQGDAEKAAGLPVGPLNDRDSKVPRCKAQAGFIRALVLPLFVQLSRVPGLGVQDSAGAQLQSNLAAWEEEIAALSDAPQTGDGS